jgi:hypothetical protein
MNAALPIHVTTQRNGVPPEVYASRQSRGPGESLPVTTPTALQ